MALIQMCSLLQTRSLGSVILFVVLLSFFMLVIILVLLICLRQLMALVLLRHTLYVTSPDGEEDDVSTLFSVSNANSLFIFRLFSA